MSISSNCAIVKAFIHFLQIGIFAVSGQIPSTKFPIECVYEMLLYYHDIDIIICGEYWRFKPCPCSALMCQNQSEMLVWPTYGSSQLIYTLVSNDL